MRRQAGTAGRVGMAGAAGPPGGFTLLEVLIAMLVLSLGAGSVLALYAAAASTHRRAVDRTHAALVAERVVAEVQARYSRGRDPGELRRVLVAELPESFGEYSWDLALHRPGASGGGGGGESDATWSEDELVVRVLVRWKRSGRARADAFHTILLPRNTREVHAEPRYRTSRTRLYR